MSILSRFLGWFYLRCLKLYPAEFRNEFEDEIRAVFIQAINDYDKTGEALNFVTHELRDLPFNLARAHWRSKVNKEFPMTIIKKPGWGFYPIWVLLTTISIPIAFILDLIILRVITRFVGDFIYVNGVRHITEDYLSTYTFVPIVGLLIGVFQYGLLRRYLPRMGWWVLATVGSWVIGMLLILILNRLKIWPIESFDLDLAFIIMGLSIGIGQWLLLRRRLLRSGWWVGANIVGWGLLSLLTTGNSIGQYGLIGLGFLPACVTVIILALLMNKAQSTDLYNT